MIRFFLLLFYVFGGCVMLSCHPGSKEKQSIEKQTNQKQYNSSESKTLLPSTEDLAAGKNFHHNLKYTKEAAEKLDYANGKKTNLKHPNEATEARGALGVGAPVARGANGGFQCATCVIVLGLVERWAVYNNSTVNEGLEKFCQIVPTKVQSICHYIIYWFGPSIMMLIVNKHSPEAICHSLRMCQMDDPHQPQCQLFHRSKSKQQQQQQQQQQQKQQQQQQQQQLFHRSKSKHFHFSKPNPKYKNFKHSMKKSKLVFQDLAVDLKLLSSPNIIDWSFCDLPYIKTFCDEIKNIFKNHSVANDKDGDKFSTTDTLRGASWRGRDCNDTSGDVHPGRRPKDGDAFEDSNCNGIWGRDPSSGRPWEQTLCGGSGSRGVAIIGDSAAAHFHVPEAWFDPTQLNDMVLHRGSFVLENEGDWPQLSSSTGFLSSSKYWPFIQGPVDSVYLRLLARNRCNHRDFQNLSVNGADSNKTLDNMRLLSRNATTDEPVIVFYAMNGNDVCNWHHDTLPFMTTAKKMAENLVSTLEYLNSTLPEGSHLIVLGMPDGRFLWDSVHSKIHPLGRLWKDVTYADIYGFWNCLQISPCFGWLNDDATIRNLTQERADNITLGLWDVVRKQQGKWKNVDVTMEESPMYDVITDWVKVGGHVSQLVEPVDGFHPNQFAMALFGRSMWNKLLKYHEDVIGTVNPHNDEIRQRFGDQGGY